MEPTVGLGLAVVAGGSIGVYKVGLTGNLGVYACTHFISHVGCPHWGVISIATFSIDLLSIILSPFVR